METNLPSFFFDDHDHNKYESLVDYWLSWTLRCTVESVKHENAKMYEYSKQILSYFITGKKDGEYLRDKTVESVVCKKGFKDVDLWVEVTVKGLPQKFVLIFENKVYSKISPNQLEKYKNTAAEHYKNEDAALTYIFYRSHGEYFPNDLAECEKNGYIPVLFDDLYNLFHEKGLTGNYLFDEYWFRCDT